MELLRRAEECFKGAASGGEPMAVILVTIDGFDRLVGTHGQDRGDTALLETAALLMERFEAESGVVGRHGDSTFAIVLPRGGREAAVRTAGEVRRAIEAASARWGISDQPLTVSAGAAGLEPSGPRAFTSVQQVFGAAARALEAARAAGGNRVRTFVPKIAA